ncbi:unnamed protein product, partial [Mesorhabditis spiculigera]
MLNYTNWMIFPMDQNDDVIYILILWTVGIIVMLGMALFGIFGRASFVEKVPVAAQLEELQLTPLVSHVAGAPVLDRMSISDATFPFTVYFLPVMVAIVIFVLGYDNAQSMTYWCSAIFGTHSNVNVLVMLTVTRPFRLAILRKIPYFKNRLAEETSNTNSLSRALREEASGY